MTRNLPEPPPHTNTNSDGRRRAHAALDEALDRADLHRTTGKVQIIIDMNEGGVRAVKLASEELFKKS